MVTTALAGRLVEAQAHAAKVLAKQPSITISWMCNFFAVPLQRNVKGLEKYLKGARIAGVPEGD